MSHSGPELPQGPEAPGQLQVVWHQEPSPAKGTGGPKRPLIIAGVAALIVAAVVGATVLTNRSPDASTGTADRGAANGSGPRVDVPSAGSAGEASATPTIPLKSAPPDFSTGLATTSPMVVRVLATTCRGTGVGTGFRLANQLVLTSYSSIDRSVSTVVVDAAGQPSKAQLVGVDPSTDVALLAVTDIDSFGAGLTPESAPLTAGDWVAAVGVLSRTTKVASVVAQVVGDDSSSTRRGVESAGLVATQASIDGGLAGSPVIDESGRLIGVILGHPGKTGRLIVPAKALQMGINHASTTPPKPLSCGKPTGPKSETVITGNAPKAIRQAFTQYFGGINAGNHDRAYAALGPKFHQAPYSSSSFDWTSSFDFNVVVKSARKTEVGWKPGSLSIPSNASTRAQMASNVLAGRSITPC